MEETKIGPIYHNVKEGYFYVWLQFPISTYLGGDSEEREHCIEVFNQICSLYKVVEKDSSSAYVPLSDFADFCLKFGKERTFHWERIFLDPQIIWDIPNLHNLRTVIDWNYLQRNPSFIPSFEILREFKDDLNWSFVNGYQNLVWNTERIDEFKEYIVFSNRRLNDKKDGYNGGRSTRVFNRKGKEFSLLGNHDTREYFYYFFPNCLSWSSVIPWNVDILQKFEKYWDWELLSENPHLPFTLELLERFASKWNWENLCQNRGVGLNISLISHFESRLSFKFLSKNTKIDWTPELLKKYENSWDWESLSNNQGIPWTLKILKQFKNKWIWKSRYIHFKKHELFYSCDPYAKFWIYAYEVLKSSASFPPSLSNNSSIIWESNMLEEFETIIDFWSIALFGKLSDDDIIRYAHYFDELRPTAKIYGRDGDDYQIQQTGWQNFVLNEKFELSDRLRTFFEIRKTKVISYRLNGKKDIFIIDLFKNKHIKVEDTFNL